MFCCILGVCLLMWRLGELVWEYKMSSIGAIQEEEAGQQPAISSLRLEDLPVETLIDIFSSVDFEAFDNMRLVNRRLRSVVQLHWRKILPGIIEREFSPVKEFFVAFWDVDLPQGVVCSHLLTVENTPEGLEPLLGFCRTIKRWETEFPRLRFAEVPDHTRSLRSHELCRLRRGLYFWWRFATAFHGPTPCLDNSPQERRVFMRQLSITELHEVWDMWQTIRRAVARKVCPSIRAVRGLGVSTQPLAMHSHRSPYLSNLRCY